MKSKKGKKESEVRKGLLTGILIISAICIICVCISLMNRLGNKLKAENKAAETELAEARDPLSAAAEEAETEKAEEEKENTPEPQEEEPKEAVQITVSAAGDCTLGTDENFDYERSLNHYVEWQGTEYFLSGVKSIFDADDLTVVNLEGTLTEATERQDKQFAFKGDPSFVNILTSGGVEAVNLANNHSKDYGTESYEDTIRYVEEAGVVSFGYDRTAVADVKGVQVGLVGIYELADGMERQQQVIDNIQAVKDQGASLVIVSFHWGTERENYPDDTQKSLAHIAIDNGADLVLGHHPHVLQGIEEYNGKNIVYSLGNFCFGGNSNPSDKDTMIFQQTFTIADGEVQADNVTNIIPCTVSSVSDYNDYQPTPAEGEAAERILGRIEEYSQF
ncbi:MAG: CapA family protein [Lachnospiraceae bacterium]|jgi:poly-gamma-glutamate capsule biosynthesis protein CapA/YwtB (metallophosphatase superfamily)